MGWQLSMVRLVKKHYQQLPSAAQDGAKDGTSVGSKSHRDKNQQLGPSDLQQPAMN